MADYDFEKLSVLIVEDSLFIRSLLINSLRILGVGKVFAVEDGGEAINFLKQVKEDPMKVGTQEVDIVMSNWQMSPVDGMILLRWARRHKESPDRFIPFIMITGFSEPKRVQEARDMGVTEFLAKPFTIQAIGNKLISIIERQRQFVHTRSYFGPDRRRRQADIDFEDRRVLTDKSPGVEIVRG
ncbi:response regulator [Iodidimonas muriae]|nr:response regulator [Iodidimonas muriae]